MKLLKFQASWCTACAAIQPFVDELLATKPDVQLEVLDVERAGPAAEHYQVRSLPTLVLVDDKGGVVGKAYTVSGLASLLEVAEQPKDKA